VAEDRLPRPPRPHDRAAEAHPLRDDRDRFAEGRRGKTTLTALLGSLLARTRRDRIVAVDTNPDCGSLGRQLTPDHDVYVDDLVDVLDRPDLSVTGLDQHLGRALEGLMVLPAPTDPERMARLDEHAYRRVIERLQSLVGILVLDCGTGLQEPAARAAQTTADQLILVSDAQPATASLVAEAAGLRSTVGPPLTLVVNKMPANAKEARIDLDGLEDLVPDAHGLVTIEDDQRAAQRVAAGDFAWLDAPEAWQRSVRELAVAIEADWPALGLSHIAAERRRQAQLAAGRRADANESGPTGPSCRRARRRRARSARRLAHADGHRDDDREAPGAQASGTGAARRTSRRLFEDVDLEVPPARAARVLRPPRIDLESLAPDPLAPLALGLDGADAASLGADRD
jgi:MinD-like ATPase involved in chromosome partitioning or flagellar assembly